MNLKELLLQFEGENGKILEAEDVIDTIEGVDIMTSNEDKIIALVKETKDIENIVERLHSALKRKNIYPSDIKYEEENNNLYIVVELEEN